MSGCGLSVYVCFWFLLGFSFHGFHGVMEFFGGDLGVGFFNDGFGGRFFSLRFGDEVEHYFLGWQWREDRHHVGGALVAAFFFLGSLMFLRFRAGDGELATHEELVMEDFDGALCLVDIEHFHETVAFGAVGVAVIDDLDAADGADSLEKLLEIAFGDIVGEVSDINAAVLDGGGVATTAASFALTTFSAIAAVTTVLGFAGGLGIARTGAGIAGLVAAWLARFAGLGRLDRIRTALGARGTDGFLVEPDGFQQFLPPAKLDGSGHRAALRLSVVLTTAGVAGAFAFATTGLAAILAAFGATAFVAVIVIVAVLPSA